MHLGGVGGGSEARACKLFNKPGHQIPQQCDERAARALSGTERHALLASVLRRDSGHPPSEQLS